MNVSLGEPVLVKTHKCPGCLDHLLEIVKKLALVGAGVFMGYIWRMLASG